MHLLTPGSPVSRCLVLVAATLSLAAPCSAGGLEPDHRYVGRFAAGCPSAVGWDDDALFTTDPGDPADDVLAEFCLYEWVGSGPPQPGRLPAGVAPDLPVVVPLASGSRDFSSIVLDSQRAWFLEQLDVVGDWSGVRVSPIRVAAIGDSPDAFVPHHSNPDADGVPIMGRGGHEGTLARILRTLTCPGEADGRGPCAAQVSHHLALSYYRDARDVVVEDTVHGGEFGYQAQLAAEIQEAVVEWQATSASSPFVAGLAVGWLPTYGGNEAVASMSPPVQAVYLAIEHAVRKGALVIAGAGNSEDGPVPGSGPMYPGGWAGELVTLTGGETVHLLHAAGGVDQRDEPLFNARHQAEPGLVAPSLLAIDRQRGANGRPLRDPSGASVPTEVLSGSSVATYVLAAAAALTWSFDHALTADAVISKIHQAARPLGRQATMGMQGLDVREIRLCPLAATHVQGLRCSKGRASEQVRITGAQVSELDALARDCMDCEPSDAAGHFDPPQPATDCPAQVHLPAGEVGPPACVDPAGIHPNALIDPFSFPLPGAVPCLDCPLVVLPNVNDPARTADLYVQVNANVGGAIASPVLGLLCDDGTVHQYPLSQIWPVLSADGKGLVDDIPMPLGCEIDQASLSVQLSGAGGPTSSTSALLVVQRP